MKGKNRNFFSLVDDETRDKELKISPLVLRNRKTFGKRMASIRRRRQRERIREREETRKFRLMLKGKYENLRVLYGWRKKKSELYDKTGDVSVFFPKRKDYLEDGQLYRMDVPPRWYNQNNEWLLSFEEYEQAWEELEEVMGFSHKDRGLGKDDSEYTWKPHALVGRRSYGSLKMGRKDRALPFQKDNLEFYIPLNKKEREEMRREAEELYGGFLVWFGPKGAYVVNEACEESLPELVKSKVCPSSPIPSTIRVNRQWGEELLGGNIYENIPVEGELFMYGDRLVVYRCSGSSNVGGEG